MGQIKNVLFTFDYELFLGSRSGSVQKCLLEPTSYLIELFEHYRIRHAIFFVDTTYLLRLKNERSETCKNDYRLIAEQLKKLVKNGHYIFPHIHPHWLDARFDELSGYWQLADYSKYRFHHIDDDQKEKLFDESILLLKDLLSDETNHPPINGYRAGGWSIQPFADFKQLFRKHGISNEFSVIKGFKNLSEAQYFNFLSTPEKSIYKFTDDPCVEVDTGEFSEYTISTLEITNSMYWLNRIWDKYLWKMGHRSLGDGIGLVIKDKNSIGNKTNMIGSTDREMISVELLTRIKLPSYKSFLRKNNYMHFISHPKMLSKHNIKIFDEFLKFATRNFELQSDFNQFAR